MCHSLLIFILTSAPAVATLDIMSIHINRIILNARTENTESIQVLMRRGGIGFSIHLFSTSVNCVAVCVKSNHTTTLKPKNYIARYVPKNYECIYTAKTLLLLLLRHYWAVYDNFIHCSEKKATTKMSVN